MDIRPVIIACLLLIAFVAAVVAVPVRIVNRMIHPPRRPVRDHEDERW